MACNKWVGDIMRRSARKPRLSKGERIVFPTKDCPLPDFDKELTPEEWAMLCHLVHSPLLKNLEKNH
ncbi:hypothetical protein LCGC14_0801730 [marine sediment metagenome]|uniref:Uncharacterized protein n=1 Tax=marine sediment metagenome TaxID=412755 RepID=A0A0F9PPC0_9ZZZZ